MRLARTQQIDALLARVPPPPSAQQSDAGALGAQWIDHAYLIALAKQQRLALRDLVRGSGVYFEPATPPPPRTAEYDRLMARLRAEEQEREYRRLVAEPAPSAAAAAALSSSDVKEVKEQLTTVLNIMVSIAAIAWAFWHWTASWDLAARTLVSLFAGIGIGVAECVVYLGYKRRVADARRHERAAKEQRSVVKKVVFSRGVEKVLEPNEPVEALQTLHTQAPPTKASQALEPDSARSTASAARLTASETRSRKHIKA